MFYGTTSCSRARRSDRMYLNVCVQQLQRVGGVV
jgi:hypothetical protein